MAAAKKTTTKGPRHWLVKSEPSVYAFERLVADGRTVWDGVRNFEARNNLRAMAEGDLLLYYHSNEGKAVVGVARVARAAYPDPADPEWSVIDVAPERALAHPVTLADIKAHPTLGHMVVAKKSRLSVTPVTADEFDAVVALGGGGSAPSKKVAPKKVSAKRRATARG